jgi:hypothetical protein
LTTPTDHYVIHHSVSVRWWLRHLDPQAAATHFLDHHLRVGRVGILAIDEIVWQTLALVADDLGDAHLAAGIAGPLFDDVTSLFDELRLDGVMQPERHETYARDAFILAALREMALADALAAVLADQAGYPLLVATDEAAIPFQALAEDRTTFSVITLAGHLGTV